MKQNLFLSRGKGILFKKISAGFTMLAMTLAMVPTTAIAIAPSDLYISCDDVQVNGNTWTFSGTWHAYDFPGQSGQYDAAVFSPSGTSADDSSKDTPDTFVITNGPSKYTGVSNKDDMEGVWSNEVTFVTPPTEVFAALYHGQVAGAETSGDAVCQFTLPPANVAPTADAGPDQSVETGTNVTFDASGSTDSDGTIVSYVWDFNDGNDGTGVGPTHTYGVAGVYTVTLTVTDDDGATSTDTVIITVEDPAVDVCDNIDDVQTEVPQGYFQDGGSCYEIPVDLCDNLEGIQTEVPQGMEILTPGQCTDIPVDVCDNIDNVQTEVPQGYYQDGGSCYEIPADSATIVVMKVVCEDEAYLPNWGETGIPEGGINANTATNFLNDVNEGGEVCYQVVDWQFQWAAGDVADPEDNVGELDEPWTTFTESTVLNLDNLGENHIVKIREVWNEAYLAFAGKGAGKEPQVSPEMYCAVDTEFYDNVEYIEGVQADETYYCIAFNVKIDMCDNIDGVQESVPEGMEEADGQCTDIVVDVCENLDEVQTEVPQGYTEEGGVCTPIVVDVCENIDEVQTEVPEGFYEDGGMCYEKEDNGGGGPTVQTDVCPNIAGNQLQIPEGYAYIDGQCIGGGAAVFLPGNPGGSGGPAGIVLGATTGSEEDLPEGCGEYLQDYLRMGRTNNPEQVMKLQDFLNRHINAGLPVTGFFGPLTFAAVQQFQVENADQILNPWVPHGLETTQVGTGYVYKTTKRWINILECASLDIPMPNLP